MDQPETREECQALWKPRLHRQTIWTRVETIKSCIDLVNAARNSGTDPALTALTGLSHFRLAALYRVSGRVSGYQECHRSSPPDR
jgi:hypothetical protein